MLASLRCNDTLVKIDGRGYLQSVSSTSVRSITEGRALEVVARGAK